GWRSTGWTRSPSLLGGGQKLLELLAGVGGELGVVLGVLVAFVALELLAVGLGLGHQVLHLGLGRLRAAVAAGLGHGRVPLHGQLARVGAGVAGGGGP